MKRKRSGTLPQEDKETIRVIRKVTPEYAAAGYPVGAKLRGKKPYQNSSSNPWKPIFLV
jgi:hypothetical protein